MVTDLNVLSRRGQKIDRNAQLAVYSPARKFEVPTLATVATHYMSAERDKQAGEPAREGRLAGSLPSRQPQSSKPIGCRP